MFTNTVSLLQTRGRDTGKLTGNYLFTICNLKQLPSQVLLFRYDRNENDAIDTNQEG